MQKKLILHQHNISDVEINSNEKNTVLKNCTIKLNLFPTGIPKENSPEAPVSTLDEDFSVNEIIPIDNAASSSSTDDEVVASSLANTNQVDMFQNKSDLSIKTKNVTEYLVSEHPVKQCAESNCVIEQPSDHGQRVGFQMQLSPCSSNTVQNLPQEDVRSLNAWKCDSSIELCNTKHQKDILLLKENESRLTFLVQDQHHIEQSNDNECYLDHLNNDKLVMHSNHKYDDTLISTFSLKAEDINFETSVNIQKFSIPLSFSTTVNNSDISNQIVMTEIENLNGKTMSAGLQNAHASEMVNMNTTYILNAKDEEVQTLEELAGKIDNVLNICQPKVSELVEAVDVCCHNTKSTIQSPSVLNTDSAQNSKKRTIDCIAEEKLNSKFRIHRKLQKSPVSIITTNVSHKKMKSSPSACQNTPQHQGKAIGSPPNLMHTIIRTPDDYINEGKNNELLSTVVEITSRTHQVTEEKQVVQETPPKISNFPFMIHDTVDEMNCSNETTEIIFQINSNSISKINECNTRNKDGINENDATKHSPTNVSAAYDPINIAYIYNSVNDELPMKLENYNHKLGALVCEEVTQQIDKCVLHATPKEVNVQNSALVTPPIMSTNFSSNIVQGVNVTNFSQQKTAADENITDAQILDEDIASYISSCPLTATLLSAQQVSSNKTVNAIKDLQAYLCSPRIIEDLDTGAINTVKLAFIPRKSDEETNGIIAVPLSMSVQYDFFQDNININKSVNTFPINIDNINITDLMPNNVNDAHNHTKDLSDSGTVLISSQNVQVTIPVKVPNIKTVDQSSNSLASTLSFLEDHPCISTPVKSNQFNINKAMKSFVSVSSESVEQWKRGMKRKLKKKYNELPPHFNYALKERNEASTPSKPVIKLDTKCSGSRKKLFDSNLSLLEGTPPQDIDSNLHKDVKNSNFTLGDIVPLDSTNNDPNCIINENTTTKPCNKTIRSLKNKSVHPKNIKKETQVTSTKKVKYCVEHKDFSQSSHDSSNRRPKFFRSIRDDTFEDHLVETAPRLKTHNTIAKNSNKSRQNTNKTMKNQKSHGFYSSSGDEVTVKPPLKRSIYSDLDSSGSKLSWLNGNTTNKKTYSKQYHKSYGKSYLQSSGEEYNPPLGRKNRKKMKMLSPIESQIVEKDSPHETGLFKSLKPCRTSKAADTEPVRKLRQKRKFISYKAPPSSPEIENYISPIDMENCVKSGEFNQASNALKGWAAQVCHEPTCVETLREQSQSSMDQSFLHEDDQLMKLDANESPSNINEAKQGKIKMGQRKRKFNDGDDFLLMETVTEVPVAGNTLGSNDIHALKSGQSNKFADFLQSMLPTNLQHDKRSMSNTQRTFPLVPNTSLVDKNNHRLLKDTSNEISRIGADNSTCLHTPLGGPLQSTLVDVSSSKGTVYYAPQKHGESFTEQKRNNSASTKNVFENLGNNADMGTDSNGGSIEILVHASGSRESTSKDTKIIPVSITKPLQPMSPPSSGGKWSLECGQPVQKHEQCNLINDLTKLNTNQVRIQEIKFVFYRIISYLMLRLCRKVTMIKKL